MLPYYDPTRVRLSGHDRYRAAGLYPLRTECTRMYGWVSVTPEYGVHADVRVGQCWCDDDDNRGYYRGEGGRTAV